MNAFYKFYCRVFQKTMKLVSPLLPWREPQLLAPEGGAEGLGAMIKGKYRKVLVVTGPNVFKKGLADGLLRGFDSAGVKYELFNRVVNNPTIDNIEEAFTVYRNGECDAIVALGGGSPMDLAKVVGARAARPEKKVKQMKGLLKIRKRIPDLYAIPTTAGSGSETTLAAVVSDSETHEKYAINDVSLIPRYAILDPKMTVGLPPQTTATTGMDALTHAVEAYIGGSNTKLTRTRAEQAVKLIFDNLKKAYDDGADIEARTNMQKASYYAGVAFTRAYVGYVHALAHALGGFYGTPHGLANAVLLPIVLQMYGSSCEKRLARLARNAGVVDEAVSDVETAQRFIDWVQEMNDSMGIPRKLSGIQEEDIQLMAKHADKEGNPLYPVPKLMNRKELEAIYYAVKE